MCLFGRTPRMSLARCVPGMPGCTLHMPPPSATFMQRTNRTTGNGTAPSSSSSYFRGRCRTSPPHTHPHLPLPLPAGPCLPLLIYSYLTLLQAVVITEPNFLVSWMQKGEEPAQVSRPRPKLWYEDFRPLSKSVPPIQPPNPYQHFCYGLCSKASP